MTEKRPPSSASQKVRECPPRTFPKVRVRGTIPPGRGLIPPSQGQFPWRNYSAADSAWVRLGPSRSAADAGGVRQIQFRRGTKNSTAESAADSADCRGTNLFRRGSDRIRGGLAELPPAECTEKGPRESATRIFRECPPRTFKKFRLRGTIPRPTTVPRNHSAANNRVAEPFRG